MNSLPKRSMIPPSYLPALAWFFAGVGAASFSPEARAEAHDTLHDPLSSSVEQKLSIVPVFHQQYPLIAARSLEENNPQKALEYVRKAKRTPLDPEERQAILFMEGLALESLGRKAQAGILYKLVIEGGALPGLDVEAAWRRYRLIDAVHSGDKKGLFEYLTSLLPMESNYGDDLLLEKIRLRLSEGDFDEACRLARESAYQREGVRNEAPFRLEEARCIELRARSIREDLQVVEFRRLLTETASKYHEISHLFSGTPAANRARANLERLQAAGIKPSLPDKDALLSRARRISDTQGPRTTAASLHAIRRILLPQDRHEIDLLIADNALSRRHFQNAYRIYSRISRQAHDRQVQSKARLGIEAIRARRALSSAPSRYITLAESYSDTQTAAEAYARAGEISWILRDHQSAVSAYEECIMSPGPEDVLGRCRFGLAWAYWREGRISDALLTLEPVTDKDERTLYWYARLLEEDRSTEDARRIFHYIATSHPFSYYSALAATRLNYNPFVFLAKSITEPPSHPDVLAAHSYLRMGLEEHSRSKLIELNRSRLSNADRRLASLIWYTLGDYPRAIRTAPGEWDNGLTYYAEIDGAKSAILAYPRPYSYAIEGPDRDPRVPKPLLYALVRAESAFDHKARSHARAQGLTQVIPPTARSVADDLELEAFRFRDLLIPETSVLVGSSYLGWLIERYKGEFPLAIAAYNAGEEAVDRWLQHRGDLPADMFIEEIPFRETNRYTRRVLSFWTIYSFLYQGCQPLPLQDIRFDLPFESGKKESLIFELAKDSSENH